MEKVLHSEQIENLIHTWANDITDKADENYFKPKYYVHKIGTDEIYSYAIDCPPEVLIAHGVTPYTYEIGEEIKETEVIDEE